METVVGWADWTVFDGTTVMEPANGNGCWMADWTVFDGTTVMETANGNGCWMG